jgi:AcrR family transcriptional regulator
MEDERRSRRNERAEETRRELIAAALSVFRERGFVRASLQEIATAAGYTTGAIYHHFGGKDELFLAVFEEYSLTRVAELAEIRDLSQGDLPERARAFADHWMARHAADPGFMVVALEFLVHSWRDPRLREGLAARHAATRLALGRILEQEASEAGLELPMPADEIATAMRELGVGLAVAKLSDPDAFPDRIYGDFVETFYTLVLERAAERARETEPRP